MAMVAFALSLFAGDAPFIGMTGFVLVASPLGALIATRQERQGTEGMQTQDLKITDGATAGAWIEPGLGVSSALSRFRSRRSMRPTCACFIQRMTEISSPSGGPRSQRPEIGLHIGRCSGSR